MIRDRRPGLLLTALWLGASALWGPAAALGAPGRARVESRAAGSLVSVAPLPRRLWIPGTTSRAVRLTYVTTNARGRKALSTGMVFVPRGRAPRGGWPVISWAHGTSGLADGCAPSVVGPALPERDRPYLANWMREGYAVVASDYAGLGTRGLPAYLHGRSEAHNIVDIVGAARAYARMRLPRRSWLAAKWVVVGQSQGGGAAIYTARYATRFGGSRLDYRGAVGTGTPADVEDQLVLLAPGLLATPLSGATNAYVALIFASLRSVHPELGVDAILTPLGRIALKLAESECIVELEQDMEGVNVSDFVTAPVSTLPKFATTLSNYLAMPEQGFDKPFFMGHGLKDTDVPYDTTAAYVARLKANGEPVTFKTYDADHSGALLASQKDTHPFVRRLFADRQPPR